MKPWKFLSRPIRNLKVDDSVLPNFREELRLALSMRGLEGIASDSLVVRLMEEAYYRAGKDEPDGIPRNGPMEDQVETIVEAVAVLFAGKVAGDAAIDAILVHHGVKKPAVIRG